MRYALFLLLFFVFTSFNDYREIEIISSEFTAKKRVHTPIEVKVKPRFISWKIPTNKSEWTNKDWLAKMLMTEVHTTDSLSIQALYLFAYTALNHTELLDTSLQAVITRPGAFSGVNKPNYKYWIREPTDIHKQIALDVLINGVPEEYKDLYAFCACESKIVSKKNKRWFKTLPKIKSITVVGIPITFYNYPYNNKQ